MLDTLEAAPDLDTEQSATTARSVTNWLSGFSPVHL